MFDFLFPKRKTGALISPPDPRDIPVSAIIKTSQVYPDKYFIDISGIEILDQGQTSSCVAYAHSYIEHYIQNENKQFSPRFIYALAKSNDGIFDTLGTYPRVVASNAVNIGSALESIVPSDSSVGENSFKSIPFVVGLINANEYKVGGYAYIPVTEDNLKKAIHQYGLVEITLQTGYWSKARVKPKDGSYYHRVVIYGYDKDYFYFINSWGTKWGDNGKGYFKLSDYKNYQALEAMVYTDIPKSVLKEYKAMWPYKYFTPSEVAGLKDELIKVLEKARGLAGVPFIPTSGLRTPQKNKEVGGAPNSSHLRGLAVDLSCTDNTRRNKILKAFLTCGTPLFISIYPTHIHIDVDSAIHNLDQVMLASDE